MFELLHSGALYAIVPATVMDAPFDIQPAAVQLDCGMQP
jgi:hypothetical protein